MLWSQTFVVMWIQATLVVAALLIIAIAVLRWIRQPVERIRLIQFALAAATATPLLIALAPWQFWNLQLFSPSDRETTSPTIAHSPSPYPAPMSNAVSRPQLLDEPAVTSEINTTVHVGMDRMDSPTNQSADSPVNSMSSAKQPRANRNAWFIAAIVIVFIHAAAVAYQLGEWIVGVT